VDDDEIRAAMEAASFALVGPRGERSADMNALGQLIGVLFVVGLIIRYFWWIALVVAAVIRLQAGARLVGGASGSGGSVEGRAARDRRPGRPAACLGAGG
jgi:hypothetical protein